VWRQSRIGRARTQCRASAILRPAYYLDEKQGNRSGSRHSDQSTATGDLLEFALPGRGSRTATLSVVVRPSRRRSSWTPRMITPEKSALKLTFSTFSRGIDALGLALSEKADAPIYWKHWKVEVTDGRVGTGVRA